MTTFYLDLEAGNDGADGTTFANRWKTITSGATAARIAPGDIIRVMASPDPTSLGQNATWTNGSDTVTLTSAVTANIDDGEAAWTAASNVTCTTSTTVYRENTRSSNNAIAAAHTTGKAAHKSFTSTNFSGYQQISFWIRSSVALNANDYELRLCSDSSGNTAVDTFQIPALPANVWVPLTINKGSALGSAIQSVALYVAVDKGACTINLDNIIACKAASSADSLTLTSLIGKNSGDDPWCAINSINGTTVKLGTGWTSTASLSGYTCKYFGTTEGVTTYKREPIAVNTGSTSIMQVQDSGTDGTPIEFQFGYDRTNMSSQSGVTWVHSQYASLPALDLNSKSWLKINRFYGVARNAEAIYTNTSGGGAEVCEFGAAASNYAFRAERTGDRVSDGRYSVGCLIAARLNSSGGNEQNTYVRLAKAWGANSSSGWYGFYHVSQGPSEIRADECRNFQYGVYANANTALRVVGCTFGDMGTGDVFVSPNARADLLNCKLESATEFTYNGIARSQRHDQSADNHYIHWRGDGTIRSATDQRHTASDISWKFAPTGTTRVSSFEPMSLPVARVACAASAQVTIKLWFRRSNTGLSMRLRVPGGQVPGVANDVTTNMSAAADTWEELTVQFTPTEAGVVEVLAEVWGGTTYSGWVDDLTVTQA